MMLRKHCRAGLLAAATISLAGCYESEFPLDPTPQVDIDPGLLGTWRCLSSSDPTEEPATFVVSHDKERVYAIAVGEKDQEPDRYEAYLSRLEGGNVLNVRNLDPGTRSPWIYTRYSFLRLGPDVLQVEVASDTLLKEVKTSPSAIRRALEQLRDTTELYDPYCICLRAEE